MLCPVISVVVLSYNRPKALAESLRSVFNQGILDLEVIVVDNLSPNSPEIAKVVATFPRVRVLPQPNNLGFTGGMNIGIAAAIGVFIHLTEDDITLDKGFYAALLAESEKRPNSLLSGLIYECPGDKLLTAGWELDIGWQHRRQTIISPPEGVSSYPVGMLEGSMIFGRSQIFRQLKGFREEFFVYSDDEELSWRARKMGIELAIVPAAHGWHANPGPFKFTPFIEYHKLKNYFALNLLYMPTLPLIILSVKYFLYTTVRKAVEGKSLIFLLNIWASSIKTLPYYLSERYRFHDEINAGIQPNDVENYSTSS